MFEKSAASLNISEAIVALRTCEYASIMHALNIKSRDYFD